jgi:hypothetical protein
MPAATFQTMIDNERTRLNAALADLDKRQKTLDEERITIKRELAAVTAYETAKNGRAPRPASGASRTPRGAKQETLLGIIGGRPDGMTRGEILEDLGVKGDKRAEGSISNALNSLKKAGKLVSKAGRYIPA